jgi:hypothetical protein
VAGAVAVLTATVIGVGTAVIVGGSDDTVPTPLGGDDVLVYLLSSRDLGALPSRDSWCTLADSADHCYLMQESSGTMADTGDATAWDLGPQGSPRQGVAGYMPTFDATGDMAWDEKGVWVDGGHYFTAPAENCTGDKFAITVVYRYLFDGDSDALFYEHTGGATLHYTKMVIPAATDKMGLGMHDGTSSATVYADTAEDGAVHCRTVSVDTTVTDGVAWYLDGAADGSGDASALGSVTTTGQDVYLGHSATGSNIILYRLRLNCGSTLSLSQHQALCGSLYQGPSDAYSEDTELADADVTYTHSGGTRCYQTAEHAATCISGGVLGWAWDSTLDASGYGRGWPQEPGRVNRIVYSASIDCSDWTCDATPTVTTAQVAPDGSATATEITTTDASSITQTATGYSGGASLYLRLWALCSSGTMTISNTGVGAGSWTVDCATVGGSWALLTSTHSAVSVGAAWTADATGDAELAITSDATGVTASVWLPTLTETAGLSVIPTAAAAVDTGTPTWTVDNSSGDYYSGSRGKLTMIGVWDTYQPYESYASDYRGRTYGDGADWIMWDGGITDASQLAAGEYHTCALKTDGSLACWGRDNYGQSTPPAGTDYAQVAAGLYHTCAVKTDGSLACWGYNNYGQSTPPAGTDYAQLAAGRYHNCALKTDGSLACWGLDNYGQSTPPAGTDYAQLAAGYHHTCAVKTDGSLACWGRDSYGQSTPPAGTDYAQVAAGLYHTCAVKTDGSLACWGYNNYGQSTPPAGTDYAQVAAGFYHTCAVKTDGSLACWGYDNYGQCAEAYPILQCDADIDGYTGGAAEWIMQWDSASYIPGYARHGVCTLGGAEQSYTIDATSPWTPATPDTLYLQRSGTVGVLHELKIEAKP